MLKTAPTQSPATSRVHASPEPLERDWDQLAIRTGASPFVRPGWISAWWRAFGQGQLEVLSLRREGRLAAVLPVARHGAMIASPTNWHTPEFGLVAEDREAAELLLQRLLVPGPRRIELFFLDSKAPELHALRSPPAGFATSERTLLRSPYLELEGDWESYFASLSKNHRGTVRRTRRRLEELGELTFEVHNGPERLEALREEGVTLELKSWKGERGTAIGSHPETRRFYREVAEWASRSGILQLAFLRLDGRPIAFELGLEQNSAYYSLKPAYEPDLGRFGPGKQLIFETMRRAFERGLASYEFLGAADPHKLLWTDTCRERLGVQLFERSLRGGLDRFTETQGRAALHWVRGRFPGRN